MHLVNRTGGWLLLVGGLAACQAGQPAIDPVAEQRLVMTEKQLMACFDSAQVIAADHLTLQVSPNFYNQIHMPAGGRRAREAGMDVTRWRVDDKVKLQSTFEYQGRQISAGDDRVRYRRRNLRFRVGRTNFLITGGAELQVLLETPQPTLTAHAKGGVLFQPEAADEGQPEKPRLLDEIRFIDGQVQVRRPRQAAPK